MRSLSVAQAKAHLSALLDAVESGEDVEITRRGIPVAKLTKPDGDAPHRFELAAFIAETTHQPMHKPPEAGELVHELRNQARY